MTSAPHPTPRHRRDAHAITAIVATLPLLKRPERHPGFQHPVLHSDLYSYFIYTLYFVSICL
jgi:hypothetical protein